MQIGKRLVQPANLTRHERLNNVGFSAVNGGQFSHCMICTLKCAACKVAGSFLALFLYELDERICP